MNKFITILITILLTTNIAVSKQKIKDKKFIEKVAKHTFRYFWEESNKATGLIKDATDNHDCSNAVVGFGLAAICLAQQQGWITYKEAYDRVLKILSNFVEYPYNPSKIQVEHEHGHHYHWFKMNTGKWIGSEGIYASDTSAFIAGVVTAGQYFKGTKIEEIANKIYENVDWTWFLTKEKTFFHIGWTPSKKHHGKYVQTTMGILPLILAISSPTYPIPVETWFNHGNTYFYANYSNYKYVGDGAAYTHQWPFIFIDPRYKKDYYLDYAQDLREFSLAQRKWAIDNKEEGYDKNNWGLNPSVGPGKYGEYASPVIPNATIPYNGVDNDGTIAPTAAISFIPFTPKESISFMKILYKKHKKNIYGKHGFKDSYNLKKNFWAKTYLGIDQGPIVLMIGNYLYNTVWNTFMESKYIKNGIKKIGFIGIIDNFDNALHSPKYAKWKPGSKKLTIDIQTNLVKEGKNAVKIDFNNIKKTSYIKIKPQLTNFSKYTYLAFWKTGDDIEKIVIKDKKNKKATLKLFSTLRDGDWELHYFDISKLKIKQGAIKEVIIYFKKDHASDNIIYLDLIHLSHKIYDKIPPKPLSFKAKTGKNSGEIDLSWKLSKPNTNQGNIANIIIKISENPITSLNEFRKLKNAEKYFNAQIHYKKQKMTIKELNRGKKYYFALAVQNNIYAESEILMANTTANSNKELIFKLDPQEFVKIDTDDFIERSADGEEFEFYTIEGKEGDALEINYNMKGESGWHWVGVRKLNKGKLPKKFKFTFYFKGTGLNTFLEFKLMDKDGGVFGKKLEHVAFDDKWQKIEITSDQILYLWGGEGSKSLGIVDSFEFAFSTPKRGKGKAAINKLTLEEIK